MDAFVLNVLAGGRLNPLGLSVQIDTQAKHNLYASTNELFELNFIKAGLTGTLSPARVHGGPSLVFQPLSIFGMQVSAQRIAYFGNFDQLQTFSNSVQNWDDKHLTDRAKKTEVELGESGKPATGWFLNSSAYLQAKANSFLGKLEAGVFLPRYKISEKYHYFYEPGEDLLFRNNYTARYLNADVLVENFVWENVRAGLSLRAFDAGYSGGESNKRVRNIRSGPTFLFALSKSQTVAFLAHWYLEHPYRTAGPKKYLPNIALAYNYEQEIEAKSEQ